MCDMFCICENCLNVGISKTNQMAITFIQLDVCYIYFRANFGYYAVVIMGIDTKQMQIKYVVNNVDYWVAFDDINLHNDSKYIMAVFAGDESILVILIDFHKYLWWFSAVNIWNVKTSTSLWKGLSWKGNGTKLCIFHHILIYLVIANIV